MCERGLSMGRKCIFVFCFFLGIYGIAQCSSEEAPLDLSRIYAVHAMHILPRDGILKAGVVARVDSEEIGVGVGLKKGDPVPGVAGWRPTLHFSVGKLADDIPSSGLIISDRSYALITPLSSLLDRLVGLSLEDAFILGDFNIPMGSTLLVREGNEKEAKSLPWGEAVTIITIKSTLPLSTAVLMNIQKKGGLIAPTTLLSTRMPSFTEENLKKAIAAYPYVILGEHQHHLLGKIEQARVSMFYKFCEEKWKAGEFKRDDFKARLEGYPAILVIWNQYWQNLCERTEEDFKKGVEYILRQYSATNASNMALAQFSRRRK